MWSLICCWPKCYVINNDLSTWKIKDKIACVICVRVTRNKIARNYKWSHGIYIHVPILCRKRKTKCLEKINFARKIIRARRFRYPFISCGLLLYTYVQWPYLWSRQSKNKEILNSPKSSLSLQSTHWAIFSMYRYHNKHIYEGEKLFRREHEQTTQKNTR